MAHRKAGGTAKNLRDSQPKYLGTKKYAGEKAAIGNVLVRQRGTKIIAGKNTALGTDHTIFATKDGVVSFREVRKTRYDGRMIRRKEISITTEK
ncbi:MAG: 50S ribosomal protein L27 [Candidatus Lloydbacteria bacterium CG22_combo_CG10-13_8_21_14_all_47_15]|uniref:Large ribosomal subunit protein bL27 n=1 Tax=Candidatus Lloydbacteria bacterium CG22_combo_CG10-13_8_21_14_all_47_15 TaxID=1974635 RepID=A0A2H0CUT6_9BACT|nr:MAG: 50S ribosomal protein L27 [Candidatus Lloydbacteria bacterium CG22_combo_CG10-13_8_21_14_all_47_15]